MAVAFVTQLLSETPAVIEAVQTLAVMNPVGVRMLHRDYLTQAKDNCTRVSTVRGR